MITLDDLIEYRKTKARIMSLSTYSVGAGIMISRINEDDHLQELHKRLRPLPSRMYLSEKEQELEMTALANLESCPAGTRSQLAAIPKSGGDEEETKQLQQVRKSIERIIEARGGERKDTDEVIERISEMQDKQALIDRIDSILNALELYQPNWAYILKSKYTLGHKPYEIAAKLGYAEDTIYRWHQKAVKEFEKLAN